MSSIPYIGSKISLISNSEIRYEGILYTINTAESTIALQSVKSFGTEGRKVPEIAPSNEVYDFIIFRGKDIKDLTVLEGMNQKSNVPNQPSALSDPAIVQVNNKPSVPPTGKGVSAAHSPVTNQWAQQDQWDSWGASRGDGRWDGGYGGYTGYGGYGSYGGYGGWDYGKGKGDKGYGKGKGPEKGYGSARKGDAYGGKGWSPPQAESDWKGGGDWKGEQHGKGKARGNKGAGGRKGKGGAAGSRPSPVGELPANENPQTKASVAAAFDFNQAFKKVTAETEGASTVPAAYDKTKSFFDSISCDALDRTQSVKRDAKQAREFDKSTFGNLVNTHRFASRARGKGRNRGGNAGKGGVPAS